MTVELCACARGIEMEQGDVHSRRYLYCKPLILIKRCRSISVVCDCGTMHGPDRSDRVRDPSLALVLSPVRLSMGGPYGSTLVGWRRRHSPTAVLRGSAGGMRLLARDGLCVA
jgi:hypothetical protein